MTLLRATPALTLISVIAGCLAAAVSVAMGPHPPRVAGFGLTEVDASSAQQPEPPRPATRCVRAGHHGRRADYSRVCARVPAAFLAMGG